MTDVPNERAEQASNEKLAAFPAQFRPAKIIDTLPGLTLCCTIAAFAFYPRAVFGIGALSPLLLAILIGISIQNIFCIPAWAASGISFSVRPLLRFSIVMLGLQLTIAQVLSVGFQGIVIIAVSLVATFVFTVWIGRILLVDTRLTQLIAAGTAICGASAIIATNTVTKAPDEDVAYAVACVTVYGAIALFVYPLLPSMLNLQPEAFGLWAGSSIHEIAQVIAATSQESQKASDFAMIAKLSRVILLAPVVGVIALFARRHSKTKSMNASAPAPWFVLGFCALVGLNSAVELPACAKEWITPVTSFLLTAALAAMGLSMNIRALAAKGFRPALLGALAFGFIASFSLALIKLT